LEQPDFDDRSTALANGSQRILQGLGLWGDFARVAEPIKSIHISERGRFGASRILAKEEGVSALGYTVENRILGSAIWPRLLEADSLVCKAPARLDSLTVEDSSVIAKIESDGLRCGIRSKLVVAADGVRSRVRSALRISALEDVYDQTAVIINCETEIAHMGRAFERFTPAGPLAFLPLSNQRIAVVWTLGPQEADRVINLEDDEFRCELQQAFGQRLGRIRRTGSRSSYPLSRVRSTTVTANRTVLVGNAAVSLHPVAGQGFNLALRDIAALAEILSDAYRADNAADLGSTGLLKDYQAWRISDQRRVAAFTHGLVHLFGYETGPLAITRGLGLIAFDLLPGAKGQLARQTMGLGGRLSRLARGLPLVP
jgi:2-octaprenyl-6-methoxyphenol hydroxylase